MPPFVEYSLTDSGKDLRPVLDAMIGWAAKNRDVTSGSLSKVMEDQLQ
ncbi:MAG: winged helix-turn-helix transcriptional regulator [Bacteroidales bacterium]